MKTLIRTQVNRLNNGNIEENLDDPQLLLLLAVVQRLDSYGSRVFLGLRYSPASF